jgi:hypothetical protein
MARASWRFALAAFAFVGTCAAASADVCSDLQARLDGLGRTNASSSSAYNTYDAQVTQQRAALDQASNSVRAAGCYGGFFSPKPSPKCPQMLSALNAMQANLNKLTAARDQYRSDPFTLANQRNDLIGQLQTNRCASYVAASPQPVTGNSLLDSLFGGVPYTRFGNGYYGAPYMGGDTYRTLCVRSCDGYYFPISYSTTADRFAADAQTCSAMCPATNASLYVYRNPGEDIGAMISLTGAPYSALPTAFKYRTSYDKSCTCGSPGASLSAQLNGPAAGPASPAASAVTPITTLNIPSANATFTPIPAAAGPVVAVPSPRPAASEDPETLANRAGNQAPAPVADANGPKRLAGVTPDGRPIRLVGPNSYVAQ